MMKKYIIDNQLLYCPHDRSLVRIGDDLSIMVLTHISDRLLCMFLESDGSVIARDTILRKVWDEHSMVSSSNNLNNYISMLRKQLLSLGLETPLIITEPKSGFRINADIVRVVIDDDDAALVSTSTDPDAGYRISARPETGTSVASSDLTPYAEISQHRSLWRWPLIGGAVFVLALIALLFVRFPTEDESGNMNGLRYMFKENGCQFYSPENSFAAGFMKDSHKIISLLVKRHALTCPADNIIIYDLFGLFNDNKYSGTVLIARCRMDEGDVLSCKNNFIYSVRIDEI